MITDGDSFFVHENMFDFISFLSGEQPLLLRSPQQKRGCRLAVRRRVDTQLDKADGDFVLLSLLSWTKRMRLFLYIR